jgi:hypothetical protein
MPSLKNEETTKQNCSGLKVKGFAQTPYPLNASASISYNSGTAETIPINNQTKVEWKQGKGDYKLTNHAGGPIEYEVITT